MTSPEGYSFLLPTYAGAVPILHHLPLFKVRADTNSNSVVFRDRIRTLCAVLSTSDTSLC